MTQSAIIPPRILSKDQAAQYCGYRGGHGGFQNYVFHTLKVSPLPGRKGFYDLAALDAALDEISGLKRDQKRSEAEKWIDDHG